jgi:hypothetical protein
MKFRGRFDVILNHVIGHSICSSPRTSSLSIGSEGIEAIRGAQGGLSEASGHMLPYPELSDACDQDFNWHDRRNTYDFGIQATWFAHPLWRLVVVPIP